VPILWALTSWCISRSYQEQKKNQATLTGRLENFEVQIRCKWDLESDKFVFKGRSWVRHECIRLDRTTADYTVERVSEQCECQLHRYIRSLSYSAVFITLFPDINVYEWLKDISIHLW